MAVRAIIFDLYGVLALNGWQAFKATHFTERPEVWDEVFQLGRQVDAGFADYDELVRFTAQQSGESEETVRYQLEHTMANTQLLEYIASHLKPQHQIGLLTNASNPTVIEVLFTSEERGLFDTFIFSRDVRIVKPDPKIYRLAADRLGRDPAECLFVDDQERHITGAKEVGMQTVLYKEFQPFVRDLTAGLANS